MPCSRIEQRPNQFRDPLDKTKLAMWEDKNMSHLKVPQHPQHPLTPSHPNTFDTFNNLLTVLMQEEPACSQHVPLLVSVDIEQVGPSSQIRE